MTAPDQTNAEVSDERLREIELCPFCNGEVTHVESWAKSFKPPILYIEYHHDCAMFPHRVWSFPASSELHSAFVAAWNRRNVTSQASEGAEIWERCAGMAHHYAELCEEAGKGDAAEELYVLEHDIRHEASKASPVSKRVERLETGWQTIETAPKPADKWSLDRVLVAFGPEDGNRVDIAYWVGSDDVPYWRSSLMEQVHGKRYMRQHQPTHWRPLIAPPQALGGRS